MWREKTQSAFFEWGDELNVEGGKTFGIFSVRKII
jgi:hypothetical protein